MEPTHYPDLKLSKIISFDIESYDPCLKDKGPGVYRKDGRILGVALSDGEHKEYYSFVKRKDIVQDIGKNIIYVTEMLNSNVPKVAANIMYDADWLENGEHKIKINGELNDVQTAEPLLCEYRDSYSLEALSNNYLNTPKKVNLLEQWCKDNSLPIKNCRSLIYLMPFELVREYAKEDAFLPVDILKRQLPELEAQELMDLYRMEMDLVPLLLQMRKTGVRIDVPAVERKKKELGKMLIDSRAELKLNYGDFNVKSGKQIAEVLDRLGVDYERHEPTEGMMAKGIYEGNPSLDKDALKKIKHPVIGLIQKIRSLRTIHDTFFINSYTNMRIEDRIHAMFHALRSDEYGTISGRLSGTKPNLQQQPSGEETMGQFCREVFIPEEDCDWGSLDWSQIEYRLIAHYARGPRADFVREKYNNDPSTDYHQMVMDWTGLDRKTAKRLNFGMAYFMGASSCSTKFGWALEEAKAFIALYHETVPFVKTTRKHVVDIAKLRGYIRTILKRRARISPHMRRERKEFVMFNRLIQGSAADIMKKSMVDAYKAGVFNVLYPHIIVHDEWDVSIPRTKAGKEGIKELQHIMETCVSLDVPIKAKLEIGPNWGNVSEKIAEEFLK